ncbi:hypothetical protein MD484_g4299, partial [Candolleomyces efflorescens]
MRSPSKFILCFAATGATFMLLCNVSIGNAAPVNRDGPLLPAVSATATPVPALPPWTMGVEPGVYATNGDDEAEI